MMTTDVFTKQVTKGIKKTVKKAIQEHFDSGHSIFISENGKIKKINTPRGKKNRT